MLKLEKNKGCKLRFVIFGHFRFPSQNNICEKLVLSSSKKPTKMILRSLGKTYAHKSQKLRTIVQKWSDLGFNLFHSFMETWVRAFLFWLFVCNMHLIFFLTLIWKQLAYANFALSNLYLHDQCLFILCFAFIY